MRIVSTTLAILLAVAPSAIANDREELEKATETMTKATSYTFKIDVSLEGLPMPIDPFTFEGKRAGEVSFVEGEIMGREIELYKKGKQIVTKNQDDEWEKQGRRGRGPMGRMMSSAMKAPHEELKGFAKKIKEVKKSEDTETVNDSECTVYEGTLTEKGAKSLLGGGGALGRMGDTEISGTAKVFVDEKGIIQQYILVLKIIADFQGNEMEMDIERKIVLTEINSTDLEIPDEVKELFNEKEEKEDKDDKKDSEEDSDEDY